MAGEPVLCSGENTVGSAGNADLGASGDPVLCDAWISEDLLCDVLGRLSLDEVLCSSMVAKLVSST